MNKEKIDELKELRRLLVLDLKNTNRLNKKSELHHI
jgi:hypothetical protein